MVREKHISYSGRSSQSLMKSTVCLNMIVRDEAHVIERCLASVRPYIDSWVILSLRVGGRYTPAYCGGSGGHTRSAAPPHLAELWPQLNRSTQFGASAS